MPESSLRVRDSRVVRDVDCTSIMTPRTTPWESPPQAAAANTEAASTTVTMVPGPTVIEYGPQSHNGMDWGLYSA